MRHYHRQVLHETIGLQGLQWENTDHVKVPNTTLALSVSSTVRSRANSGRAVSCTITSSGRTPSPYEILADRAAAFDASVYIK